MANQDGDIDALEGSNSKSSKHVRHVPCEARTTRCVGDRPQGPGCGLVFLPSPFADWLAARTAFARRCNCVHDAIIQWREVDETSNALRVFQRRKRPQQGFRPDRSQADKLPRRASASPWLAGGILVAAGAFQFSKLKEVCLNGCRTPVTFFMTEWREGYGGALMMGLKHGLHCVGCCWVLMALLFVAGVMNLLWMAIITVFVLLEKVLPKGVVYGRVGGVAMILWGMALMLLPLIAW